LRYIWDVIVHPKGKISEISFNGTVWFPLLLVALLYGLLRLTSLPEIIAQYDTPEFREMFLKQAGVSAAEA